MGYSTGGTNRACPSITATIEQRQAVKPYATLAAIASHPSVTMTLTGQPYSPTAVTAINALSRAIFRSETQKKKPSIEYIKALGAAVADLLNAASFDPISRCARKMNANAFKGGGIGYAPFFRVLEDLHRHGLIEWIAGREGLGGRQGYITRIIPTTSFVQTMRNAGIAPDDRLDHFTYGRPPLPLCPVRLKESNNRGPEWQKIKGKEVYLSMRDAAVSTIASPIARLNTFYQGHTMTFDMAKVRADDVDNIPVDPPVFFRGFNCGEMTPYPWNRGGRFYTYDGHYQQLHKESRRAILIDGEPAVEVDLHACYLSIVYGLLKRPLHATDDLYTINGINRNAVKSFVNTTLSKGSPIERWSQDHCERYDADDRKRLQRECPIKEVAKATLTAIPIIALANANGIDWSTLIYEESEVMQATLLDLAFNHCICAYPMHDGLIVSTNHIEKAKASLSTSFKRRLGVTPIIRVK